MTRVQSILQNGEALKRRIARSAGSRRIKMTVYLSQEAKENLERLRLRLLDRQGRKPAESQIIEGLLKTALEREETTPYPVKGRSR